MQKIFLFGLVFLIGLASGGFMRYETIEASFEDVEITNSVIPSTGGSLGSGGGGSCG